jgi:hypothetical protein
MAIDRTGKLKTSSVVVRAKAASVAVTDRSDSAGVPLQKHGQALRRPGLSHQALFGDNPAKFAYSVYPADPSKVLRISAEGTRTIGRLARGRFQEIV